MYEFFIIIYNKFIELYSASIKSSSNIMGTSKSVPGISKFNQTESGVIKPINTLLCKRKPDTILYSIDFMA